jgi:hypothetical protein
MPSLIQEITAAETAYFWVRTLLLFILVFLVTRPEYPKTRPVEIQRERLQDTILDEYWALMASWWSVHYGITCTPPVIHSSPRSCRPIRMTG